MKLEDKIVDLMAKIYLKKYSEYVTYENGKKVLYLRVLNTLYGCIGSGILFYSIFTRTFKK